jgi:hypothetical protein
MKVSKFEFCQTYLNADQIMEPNEVSVFLRETAYTDLKADRHYWVPFLTRRLYS